MISLKDIQLWTKYCREVQKLSEIGVPLECLIADFSNFLAKLSEFGIWVTRWRLAIRCKLFRGFLDIS